MAERGVELNSYDEAGNTALMAFVIHLRDGDDDNTLSAMLRYLINNGADVHRRNCRGETALHIAVRLGHKTATAVLLAEGSNVHARTLEGKGVLALGEREYFAARTNPQPYASIMACMALCMHYGAVANPTLVQEWLLKSSQKSHRTLKR
ncbi:hypothetical protein BDZ45DRAFT_737795 [Acephala macrosclerotiorum]|nr:hypothetical protein BDZ45DRAFT_737795 [Acephala macrosclerotiorum]